MVPSCVFKSSYACDAVHSRGVRTSFFELELELEVTFEFDSTTKFEGRKNRTSKRIRTYNNEIEPGHKMPTFV